MADGREKCIIQQRHIKSESGSNILKSNLSKLSLVAKRAGCATFFSQCLKNPKTSAIPKKDLPKEADELPIYSVPGLLKPGCFAVTLTCVTQKKDDTLLTYITDMRINTDHARTYNCLNTLFTFNSMQYLITN